MRVAAVLTVGLVALCACSKKDETVPAADSAGATASATAPAGPATLPRRKPGLWAHTINAEGVSQTMKLCIDADTDAKDAGRALLDLTLTKVGEDQRIEAPQDVKPFAELLSQFQSG